MRLDAHQQSRGTDRQWQARAENEQQAWEQEYLKLSKRYDDADLGLQRARRRLEQLDPPEGGSAHALATPSASGKEAPLPKNLPKFTPRQDTTPRNVEDYLTILEGHFRAACFPEQRWVGVLPTLFNASSGQEQPDVNWVNWVNCHLINPGLSWEQAKPAFVQEFGRARDPLGPSAHLLDECRQPTGGDNPLVNTKNFVDEFTRRVGDTFTTTAGGQSWQKDSPIFTLLFLRALKPGLREKVARDNRLHPAVENDGFKGAAQLAIQVEEELRAANAMANRTGLGASLGKRRATPAIATASPNKRMFLYAQCTICKKRHPGPCFYAKGLGKQGGMGRTLHQGGKNPMAKGRSQDGATSTGPHSQIKCFLCQRPGHKAADCKGSPRVNQVNALTDGRWAWQPHPWGQPMLWPSSTSGATMQYAQHWAPALDGAHPSGDGQATWGDFGGPRSVIATARQSTPGALGGSEGGVGNSPVHVPSKQDDNLEDSQECAICGGGAHTSEQCGYHRFDNE